MVLCSSVFSTVCRSQNCINRSIAFQTLAVQLRCHRFYATAPKRFYRKTGVIHSNGNYEITLDQRKLKTPQGNPFIVHNEPLALAVAAEWDAQKEKIQRSTMHLTALCSTVIDNPTKQSKFDLVQSLMNFLETDTVLFHSEEEDELYDLQKKEWSPIIDWFCQRYEVSIRPSRVIEGPVVSEEIKATISRHLLSYNIWAIHGFAFGIDAIKSLILTLCCADRYINIKTAVLLSRLEEEYQTGRWGRVEWAHDISQMETQARLAAAILFIHLNSSSYVVQAKQ
ncbi:hypothetical protein R5R35_002952 [Gryllus longicercus]|uniref:ATP synthase mitochondrial F1 complex assembly factor 2 n=1 Tax=Gryllus longicercus TaxID=2509291 RepID=A0AAN9VEY1_9ORTH